MNKLKLRAIIYAGIFSGCLYFRGMFDETLAGRLMPDLLMLAMLVIVCFDKEYLKTSAMPKWFFVALVIIVIGLYVFFKMR